MDKFAMVTSVAAPLPREDIDTDLIYPARFLLLIDRSRVGKHLFHDLRHDHASLGGGPDHVFVLDREPYKQAAILVCGFGFGTGSSREHAVWALADAGIRCVIAPSLGEIFQANCVKNGILPVLLDGDPYAKLLKAAERAEPVTIDLNDQEIRLARGSAITFDVDPESRRMLLEGLDEIEDVLVQDIDDIDRFERTQRENFPWLYLDTGELSQATGLNCKSNSQGEIVS
ncbi:3-isopropylmalate dehydratase small subunit [Parasphingopyxis algicola]|uniref:3-isopropylmalate dehydratase small subunit n=1 Tax=Parasphingopyxis algicola TaxID=2026624 RepID=UPI0015A12407|nr:3-isopropylmalate dehydratase small subunit [Parasphingopyxis algicola]QLC26390.1 3-isopropylmalate dehydratase small subunit [Parasphingopyxis algicola]